MGEIEAMCAPLHEAARHPDTAGSKAFRETWADMADKLIGLAEEKAERWTLTQNNGCSVLESTRQLGLIFRHSR